MRLNTLKPAFGSKTKRTRIGRGMGSGLGKTCGYGHKGQKARSGYGRKIGFEGGQLPLQRRLPKFGFSSYTADKVSEVRLRDLNKIKAAKIDLAELKKANLINNDIQFVKVILAGSIDKAITLVGIKVTAGVRQAIEKAGGKIE
ncbi:MAG: 50S ribosomal protein L15 [uncultured bacterium]|nr:MAG: 50S ribosomal protein L15 [uncultured bacterium]HBC71311.1 50S ribosomal protein L15 [Coxiellaceae bacterium]HBS51673.1 50S ribosomal protein L15 [Coxiellaceae bacterium]HBY55365.1 50S ribosomal protein L15 [Coxiellaceae bacterium]